MLSQRHGHSASLIGTTVYLSIFLSISLSIYLGAHTLSSMLSQRHGHSASLIGTTVYLSTYLSFYINLYLSIYWSFYLNLFLSMHLIFLSISLSIYLGAHTLSSMLSQRHGHSASLIGTTAHTDSQPYYRQLWFIHLLIYFKTYVL